MVVRIAALRALVDMGQYAEPVPGILVEHLARRIVVRAEMGGDEILVLERRLHMPAHRFPPPGPVVGNDRRVAVCGKLFERVGHIRVSA